MVRKYICLDQNVTSAKGFRIFANPIQLERVFGPMAEWLGSALQKLLQRFESASDLNEQKESPVIIAIAGLF